MRLTRYSIADSNDDHLYRAFTVNSVFGSAPVHADSTFNVNSTLDQIDSNVNDGVCRNAAGTCTIRAAVMQANHLTSPGIALIDLPAGIYLLTLSQNVMGNYNETNSELQLTTPLANAS